MQTSTQYYNTNIQNWIKIATLLYVFVFVNSLRAIWMFTFCLGNLDSLCKLCKLCNSTLHFCLHESAWSLSTHHPIISTSWSWKPIHLSNHLFFTATAISSKELKRIHKTLSEVFSYPVYSLSDPVRSLEACPSKESALIMKFREKIGTRSVVWTDLVTWMRIKMPPCHMCLIQASNVHTQQYFFSGLVSDSMWPKNDETAKDWD